MTPHAPSSDATALKTRFCLALGLVWVITGVVAMAAQQMLGLTAYFVPKTLIIAPILGWLSWYRLVEHGHQVLGPANQLTLGRAVLVGLLCGFVFEPTAEGYAPGFVFVSGLAFFLDAIDGHLARQSGVASPFGAQLDMELDGLTVLVLSGLAWYLGRAGWWIWIPGILRPIWVLMEMGLPWMRRPLYHTYRRAWACGILIGCQVWCLFPYPEPLIAWVLALVGTLAVTISFVIDIRWLFSRRSMPLR